MAETLLFKCTDITDPFIKSPEIPKVPRSGEPRTYTNLFILQLMKQEAQKDLAGAFAVSCHQVRIGIWVPCLGFFPIQPLFI